MKGEFNMANKIKGYIHLITLFIVSFIIVFGEIEHYVFAADTTVERPQKLYEENYNDENYTYSYNRKEYFNFTTPVSWTGNTTFCKEYILDLKNSDVFELHLCGEFYCAHRANCVLKGSLAIEPIDVTVNIGNGKVIKTFRVKLKPSMSTTIGYTTVWEKYVIDDLAKFGLSSEEKVDITISSLENTVCDSCGYIIKKGIKIAEIDSYDYRGICNKISSTSNSNINTVTISATVDKYVKRCEWYILFEGEDKETLLKDGVLDNGMLVIGANTERITLQNIPQNKGKTATMFLLTYDENDQGVTNLNYGEYVYKTDIAIEAKFETGLNDVIANVGQIVSLDVSSKIPSDTRTIKWQNSSDGKQFSDNFYTATFSGKVYSSNNALLKINGVTNAMNGYYFRCVCLDEYGRKSVSDSLRLYVNKPFIFYNNNPISAIYINGKKVL